MAPCFADAAVGARAHASPAWREASGRCCTPRVCRAAVARSIAHAHDAHRTRAAESRCRARTPAPTSASQCGGEPPLLAQARPHALGPGAAHADRATAAGRGAGAGRGGGDRRISLRTGRVRKISVDGKGVLKRKQMLAVRARDPAPPPLAVILPSPI